MVRVRILPTDSSMMIGYKFFWSYLIDHKLAVHTGHITHQHQRTIPLRSQTISYFPEPSPVTDYTVQLGVTGFHFLEGVMVQVKLDRSLWFCFLYSAGFGLKSQPWNGPFWEFLWFYSVATGKFRDTSNWPWWHPTIRFSIYDRPAVVSFDDVWFWVAKIVIK